MTDMQAPQRTSAGEAPTVRVVASGPAGMLECASPRELVNWIAMHGGGKFHSPDHAKDALFREASQTLVLGRDGKPRHLRLFTLPIAASVVRGMSFPVTLDLVTASERGLSGKLREIWARAFGAAAGLMISPLPFATNCNGLLDLSPLTVRDCVAHGAALAEGRSTQRFCFESGDRGLVQGSSELPVTYMLAAYVMWEVGAPEPVPFVSPSLSLEVGQLFTSLLAKEKGAVTHVLVGPASFIHDGVTEAQGLQLTLIMRRAAELEVQVLLDFKHVNETCYLEASYYADEEPLLQLNWSYSSRWRPLAHQSRIGEVIHHESRLLERREHFASQGEDGCVATPSFVRH